MTTQSRKLRRRQAKAFVKGADPKQVTAYLSFNLLVGAAAADASPEQHTQLEQIPELIKQGEDIRKLAALVFDIMGVEWSPGPEWMQKIEALQETR